MSRGGSGPGWGWWPPSRRRPGRRRRPAAEGDGADGGRTWALPALAGLAVAASLSLLVLLLGLSGAALAVAAGGGAWAAAAASVGKSRKPPLLARSAPVAAPWCKAGALANGGPAVSCSPAERRRLYGDPLTPPTHFALRRRYPIKKAQYASFGTLPSICWDSYRRKTTLSTHNSCMIQSPVTVKIARPDSSIGRSPLLEQLASPLAFSPTPNSTLDPCAKETVLSALKESRKRNVEDDDQSFPSGQENKRRRHDSSGSGQSAFEPLVANGTLASLVPKPGSLKRSLISQCLDNCSSKRSRTSSLSSVNSLYVGGIPSSIRNAIASSYSSTRGISQLWKRSGPSTSPLSSPASSRSQTPERPNKKARHPDSSLTEAESHQSSTSTPVKASTERQAEKRAETPVQNRHTSLGLQSSSGSNGKRKRKIQLLSAQRGDNFTLPPPPQVGYAVTSEDLDAEKKATLQWFNKALEDKSDSTPSTSAEIASPPSTLSSLIPAPVPLTSMGAGTNPLLESLKKMQEGHGGVVQADSASAAQTPETAAPVPLDLGSPVSVTSPEVKPSVTLSVPPSLAPPSSAAAQPASSLITTSCELGQTPSRPSSAPKPSILFGILTSPPASQPTTTAAAASSASNTTPVFKPIFGNVTKIESAGFSSGSTSATVTSSPGTAPSSAPPPVSLSSSTFKPIFGSVLPLATAAPTTTTASFFGFKSTPQPAPGLSTTSSALSGFPVLSESVVTTAMSPLAPVSVTTVSTSAPVFSFGLGMPASTSAPSSTTTVTTASSQPFMFGVPSSGAAASSAAAAPLFLFGKPSTTAGPSNPLASSAFSQAPASTAESVLSSSTTAAGGFNIFSSGGSSAATTQAPSAAPPSTQPTLTFGSGPSPFSGAFATPSKPPPPYPGDANQLTFEPGVPDGQQQQLSTKPPAAASPVSFGTPFSFSGSVAQPAAQPAFGSATQTTFGGTGPLASFGTKSTAQPAFGATTSIFSFGTATTSATAGFGSSTQTTNSSTGGSVFGSATASPFTFGATNAPTAAGGTFGIGAPVAAGSSTPMVGFSFGGQSGGATPFASSMAQIPLGAQNQNAPFAFNIPGTPENKPAFGGAPAPAFGQGSAAPGGTTGGSSLSFGTPIAPTFGGSGPTFGPTTLGFSIGAGSKQVSRQRLQARRQHTRKK
ncbi:nuclear envelope pore membrane protein POM 121 [Sphaerodactylus townsendi]|uniref:nuclear envelope pore membrane protein POM 121 n=1 Tax=Sphaerodactylus townsendi TaxID=933632 RepID=UPI0020266407|nr:nuclear envelope pore membrane protein POM 121 [Sphaerodactylus townsendi]